MNSDVGAPCDRRASPKDHVQESTSENIWNLNVASQHKNLSRLQRIPWKHCKNDVMETHEMELIAWECAPIETIYKFKNLNIEIWSSRNNVRLMSITIYIYKATCMNVAKEPKGCLSLSWDFKTFMSFMYLLNGWQYKWC